MSRPNSRRRKNTFVTSGTLSPSASSSGARPVAEAIVTAGGVSTKEVDPRTMMSKLVPGLYFAGEVLDLDAYTGGYNLQIAWSTAYVAANSLKGADE